MDASGIARLESLIRRRRAAGISQAELARHMHTSQPSLARLEAPGSNPRLSTVERYSKALADALVLKGGAPAPEAYSLETLEELSEASFENSGRLAADARLLLDAGRVPTAYAVAVAAWEEAAKPLLLTRAGTDLALGNRVDWKDLRRRLADHGSKLRTLMLFDWAVNDQAAAWAAADVEGLIADTRGRRKAADEATEAVLLRERALYTDAGPTGTSRPESSILPDDAVMAVEGIERMLQTMQRIGLPPPRGSFKRLARDPAGRKRALVLRKGLNQLPSTIPLVDAEGETG